MQHLWILVVHTADAVTAVLAHHRIIVLLDEALDGVADVAEPRTRTHRVDTAPHGREAGLGQTLSVRWRPADEVHAAGVAMEAFTDDGHIDIDDVPGLQALVVGDPMAHHVVDGGADGLRKSTIVQIRRHRALHVDDVVVTDTVELLGRHSRHHVLADHVEHLGGEPTCDSHFFLLFRCLDGDVHKLRNGVGDARPQGPSQQA
jgi:hypothetical protein